MPRILKFRRKFGDKTYHFVGSYNLKSFAQKTAKGLRDRGNLARMTKEDGKWTVWVRAKV